MRKKEQMFWLASRSRMWRIPLCMAAFSLLPSAYSFASAENPATETVLAVNSVQQQRTVKGIVIDANGEAVMGANVKEPGSTTGTITDMNGEFSLSVALSVSGSSRPPGRSACFLLTGMPRSLSVPPDNPHPSPGSDRKSVV